MSHLSQQRFELNLKKYLNFTNKPQLAVAVSGGADSMALAIMAQKYAVTHQLKLIAITIDHRLREEAAAEAEQVGQWLKQHDISHITLKWNYQEKPTSNIQAKARAARYQLLIDYCKAEKIGYLLLGHHLDDQIETFLLNLERGSGLDGLCAMPFHKEKGGVNLIRPFLTTEKTELIEYLNSINQAWIEDPSNQNPIYKRVFWRQMLKNSKIDEQLFKKRISETIDNLQRVKGSIDYSTLKYFEQIVTIYPQGYALIKSEDLSKVPLEEAYKILLKVISKIGGDSTRPRFASIKLLYENLFFERRKTVFTLGQCKFILLEATNNILIVREIPRNFVREKIEKPGKIVWQKNFVITLAKQLYNLVSYVEIGYLGKEGWIELCKNFDSHEKITFNKEIIFSLPAVWGLDKLVAVPQLDYYLDNNFKEIIDISYQPVEN